MTFVVTAGPTREFLDPVRFLSNPSTGKMGFAIAAAAARRGHDVTLVAGPVALKTPKGVKRVDVVSAREMMDAAWSAVDAAGRGDGGRLAFVATAAVADWRPEKRAARKMKKARMDGVLKLVRNPDVLKTVSERLGGADERRVLVGFAAETGNAVSEARRKCREKGLSMVVANDVTEKGAGFGTDTNRVAFARADGSCEELALMTKRALAVRIVRECERNPAAADRRDGSGGGRRRK